MRLRPKLALRPAWLLAGLLASATPAFGAEIPKGFVHLSEIAPAIGQDMRYAGADNFTGAPVPGYRAPACILARPVALALKAVADDLAGEKLGLIVHDCYRPAKAVRAFVAWAGQGRDTDPLHHPHVRRDRLIAEGYIGRRSGHSSGGTVDLTLARLTDAGPVPMPMGTAFDVFDPAAHTASTAVSKEARANRRRLVEAMERHGFRNYHREWWHFSFRNEPFAGRAFDFDVTPKTP